MTDQTQQAAMERESFEAFCSNRWGGIVSDLLCVRDDGEYINGRVQFAWSAFQAGRSTAAPAVGAPVAWAKSSEWNDALRGQSFNGWRTKHRDCDMALYLAPQPAAISGSLEAVQRDAWRPMKTAPKDGTAFLACLEASDIPHAMRFEKDGRLSLTWDGFIVAAHDWPTHWMPLPPAPIAAAPQKGTE